MMARLMAQFTLVILSLILLVSPARAEMLMTFYSHDFNGNYFPHTFIRLQGTVEETGEIVDTNYGFTAKNISPAILLGSVYHEVSTVEPDYLARSQPHFTLRIDDAKYREIMGHVGIWRNIPGKGYRLGSRNCIHFVMEAAALAGLKVNRESRFFKKPKSFLLEVKSLNEGLTVIQPAVEAQTASKPAE